MKRWPPSPRWQLAIVVTILLLISTLGCTLYTLRQVRQLYISSLEDQLGGQARLVADAVTRLPPTSSDGNDIQSVARRFGTETGNRVTIIRSDGVVLGDSQADPAAMENHATRPEVLGVLALGNGRSVRHSVTVGIDYVYVAVPIIEVSGRVTGVARVARPLSAVDAQLGQLRYVVGTVAAVLALVAGAVALVVVARVTRPLIELKAMAGEFGGGRLGRRQHIRGAGEIAELGKAFNRMADELERTIGTLETEHGKLHAILEALGDGILMVDHDKRIVLANPVATQLVRLKGDPVGRPFIEAVLDHELDELVTDVLNVAERRERIQERAHPRRTVRIVATPVQAGHERLGLLTFQDLTHLRRLETARRDFVANISHELRTPLASIKALVETLRGDAIDDPADARHFLEQVDNEVDHMTQLVRELLELSRIESGQAPLVREPVHPRDLVSVAIERLRAQAERAGLEITSTCLDELPLVLADPQRIGQAMLNLLHNAIKFTPPGGKVSITGGRQGAMVTISVVDTGVGIAPADVSRIFERFYKADKARTGSGAGLGLAIVKHIIELHGGAVWAESRVGRGAVFTLTLPIAPVEQRDVRPTRA